MPEPEICHYVCDECGNGILTLKRWGIFVSGKCDGCGHEVDFELPDEALATSDSPVSEHSEIRREA